MRTADLVSNNGWTFQISPDGGTTWNTRLFENYTANTIALTSCTLNATATVTCASTIGLAVGMVVQGTTVSLASCGTTSASTTVTCASTTGLAVGMFVTGNGIANNTRVTALTANTNFTLSAAATATGSVTVLANYFNANTAVSSITNATTFVVNNAAFYSGGGLALNATTINHAFALKHYDLVAADMSANMKMRFQWSGYSPVAPIRPPTCDIDDIIVTLTTGSAPVTVAMLDDGLHGDGAAGNGVYGVQIPAQTAGTTVSYTITATDSNASSTTSSSASYTVATAAPVLAITPATTLSSAGAAGSGSFSPSSIPYTLANNGTGTMSWTATKSANWLTLSSASGTLAAGANMTVTASINTTNANSLSAATYSDTITFTNSTNGTGNATHAVSLLVTNGVPTALSPPAIATLPTYSAGTSRTIAWPAVVNATSYTLQISSSANFATNLLSSQTGASPTGGFTNLVDGVTYYYRVLATNSIGSSSYSNTVSSTQDTVPPVVAITSPASAVSTAVNTITVAGTSSDTLSGVSGVKVNNVAATSSNNFATWIATVPLGFGTNAITATAFDGAGNLATSAAVAVTLTTAQTYNPLNVPDIITGTTFNLALNQTTKQFRSGNASTTYGYNGALFWGPTLIMNQGDVAQMNVTNNLIDTTTVHWHGLHIPAIMDGGPHQTVPAGTTWSPSFTVKNNAATYWYHPHLHTTTQQQLTLGAGGFIIVKDPQEAALALPRTYGVDDFPLAVTSRRFLTRNILAYDHALDNYGDYVLLNGTITPQVSLPKQYVRLRILNAEVERGYNLGFSDNRTFYVIGNDQGLLNAPVAVTRLFLMEGERVEIMVNLGSDTVGTSIDLKAYNSGQVFGFPGQEGNPVTPSGNSGPINGCLLNNTDFNILHINVAATTSTPITALPATLASNTYWTNADVTNTRTINLTGGGGGGEFTFNNVTYASTVFNQTINLNAIKQWNISNTAASGGNIFGHSIHIHDIKFKVIARSGGQVTDTQGGVSSSTLGLAAKYESGWKDTVYVPKGESVSVIAKYDDFASNTNPFMYHCHFLQHEDNGMMGQFVVVNSAVEDLAVASFTRMGTSNLISLQFKATVGTTYNLQYSPNMTASSWITVGSVTSDGTSATFTETDATRLSQARGFYRVTIPVIP